jgi:hypothetical protein
VADRIDHLIQVLFKVSGSFFSFEISKECAIQQLNKYLDLTDEVKDSLRRIFTQEDYFGGLGNIYRDNFSEEELEKIIDFWQSGVGRKLLSVDFAQKEKQFLMNWAASMESEAVFLLRQQKEQQGEVNAESE